MSKKTYGGLQRNNELLAKQNDLLQEQNNLLRGLLTPALKTWGGGIQTQNSEREEVFIENIDRDEMRSGFLVTSHRKKLWNVQIKLINEFARVCKKYNLRWFAIGGTLLGAARHKGFIPWDDDVDIIMFRPDYEKFKLVAENEIKAPYFLDHWYNYRLESEGASLEDSEGDFQFITLEQQRKLLHISYWPLIKIRDSRTTMIEFADRNFINQGIWIDIFSLDPVPPFTQEKQELYFEAAKTLVIAAAFPQHIKKTLQDNQHLLIDRDDMERFLALPYRERGRIFENFMKENFFMSEYANDFMSFFSSRQKKPYKTADFAEVTYLPFEKIELPAPACYESVLTDFFGDWHKMIYTHSHAQFYSAEIPWREYFQKTAFK